MAFVADNSVVIAWLTESQANAYTRRLFTRAGLLAYDAAYIELAERRGLPLATRDRAMRLAAQRVGIALV